MRLVKTHEMTSWPSSETEKLHIYNGLDCCVTFEVLEALEHQHDSYTRHVYDFARALQAPCLEMRLRGVLIDPLERERLIKQFEADLTILSQNLEDLLQNGLGLSINWRSPKGMQKLFYETLALPPVKKRNSKGEWAPTVDRAALEKLDSYFDAQPFVSHLLAMRDLSKKIGVLKTEIDPDGRMRTSFNIGGTNTGRLSSSFSDLGTGTNLQNIEQRLRRIFIADPGMKFAYIDLEQAESRAVGAIEWNLFHDGTYLDACESGDLHTTVCKLAWPHLGWTGDPRRDRDIAEQPFYRQHSYRHMAKVLGHGTNYLGTPGTMAKHTKIEQGVIAQFQAHYFKGFPGHPQWHASVKSDVYSHGFLVSLMGRKRWFFGRRNDDATVREAVAFDPQGSVGDILNRGMLRMWRANIVQILLQIHDALLIQYPEDQEDLVLSRALDTLKVPVPLRHNRTLLIPSEAKVGWNWAEASSTNPDGLIKYRGHDDRNRQNKPETKFLDRCVLPIH